MDKPVRINFHHMQSSNEVRALVESKSEKLVHRFPRVTQIEVDFEVPHRHQASGHQVQVRLLIHIPGGPIAVNQGHEHENMAAAAHDAFRAAHRELGDLVASQRDRARQVDTGG